MIFDAGNIVVPLVLGRALGGHTVIGLLGLLVTSFVLPFLGFLVSLAFEGKSKAFLATTGIVPAFVLGAFAMLLVGPLGATPRCVTLAHEAFSVFFPHGSLVWFSSVVVALIFILSCKKGRIVALFGAFLGPIMMMLLAVIIVASLYSTTGVTSTVYSKGHSFLYGFKLGYFTLDLLYTIFFAGVLYAPLCSLLQERKEVCARRGLMRLGVLVGGVGFGLLALVALGFAFTAAYSGTYLSVTSQAQLLYVVATRSLGPSLSWIAHLMTFIACFTTALALVEVFTDYVYYDLLHGRCKRFYVLLGTVIAVFIVSNLGFSGVARVIEPLAIMCYPLFIVITLSNALLVWWNIDVVKPAFYGSLSAMIVWYGVRFLR
ncbi:MAG: hypothetical protein US69_C0010G0025 [candidate division TM6 bacterium GW2011_GWF2_38_10]|nr:MAG: hypothetical protein US69_C0010G0025 [candidate division TM6 bacterium GW2011_GWF2_38_10]